MIASRKDGPRRWSAGEIPRNICRGIQLGRSECCSIGNRYRSIPSQRGRGSRNTHCHIGARRRVVSAIRWREKHAQRVVAYRKDGPRRWSVGKTPRNICRGIQLGRSKRCSIGNRYRSIPIERWLSFWREHCGCVGVIEGRRVLESGIRSEEYPE